MAEIVKYRTVSITIHPWRHGSGAIYHQFSHAGKKITRSTLKAARSEALRIAHQTYRGQLDLADLPPEVTARLKRLLDADPDLSFVDDYLRTLTRFRPVVQLSTALQDFLSVKVANRGASVQNVRTLTRYLTPLLDHCGPNSVMDAIPARTLQQFIDGPGQRQPRY